MSDELNQLKIDIALIKKDIKQIERFFTKIDEAVNTMAMIAKNIAVQEEVVRAAEQKLQFLEKKIEEHTKMDLEGRLALKEQLDETRVEFRDEIAALRESARQVSEDRTDEVLEKLDQVASTITKKVDEIEGRVRTLENLRWYVAGIAAVVVILVTKISFDLSVLFS